MDYDKHTVDVRDTIQLILPSEWAKYDLSLYHVYKDIIEGDHHSNPEQLSIEKSPIIKDRPTIIGSSTTFWAKSNNCIVPAPTTSTLQFICPYTNKQTSLYKSWPTCSEELSENSALKILGIVGVQWCVTKSGYTSPRNSPTDVNLVNNN